MRRDLCATVYIIHEDKVLLLYHRKLQKWLPPGGHVDPNETPDEAAIREAWEETNVEVELISFQTDLDVNRPNARSLPAPFSCLLEEIPAFGDQPAHQHIDMVYMGRPKTLELKQSERESDGLRWFSMEEVDLLISDQEIFEETKETIRYLMQKQYSYCS